MQPKRKVMQHAKCIVVIRDKTVDLVDPVSGRWQTFSTPRSAKWHATVWSRMCNGFGMPTLDDAVIQHQVGVMG